MKWGAVCLKEKQPNQMQPKKKKKKRCQAFESAVPGGLARLDFL